MRALMPPSWLGVGAGTQLEHQSAKKNKKNIPGVPWGSHKDSSEKLRVMIRIMIMIMIMIRYKVGRYIDTL